uniref:Ubiquinol-cytochrome C reductase complex ubiquinone-binding family protein n=1 Tax=Populus alba TaxID=43335 RepID=A0A4U5MNI1_POPAL|nr:ubiquinol-cytochrome C reductase complex ubiquinone-binding family protein [Populus alba]
MGKQPVKVKAVVYALSPFQQKVMPGLWKDLPGKIHHKVSENWISATLLLAPLVGVYTYVQNYQEKEKLEHRCLYWKVEVVSGKPQKSYPCLTQVLFQGLKMISPFHLIAKQQS